MMKPTIILLILVLCQVCLGLEDKDTIYQYNLSNFNTNGYTRAVNALFNKYEHSSGVRLYPGPKRCVGLKVYTESRAGLSTPVPLVRAVISALEARGFRRSEIFIIGERAKYLREAGFIPPISVGGYSFERVPVLALDRGKYYHSDWFYESPIPSKLATYRGYAQKDDKKSFLPVPLCLECDFWINLPVVTSHKATGVTGSIANASILNVSNNRRFFDNPLHCSVAMAEICAIPELQETCAMTLLSLERYQCIGGSKFHSLYTNSEPILYLSENSPALDYLMYQRINKLRSRHGFPPLSDVPAFIGYCKRLALGDYEQARITKLN